MKRFYVYGYVRSKDGQHGSAGSYYYIGKGQRSRKTSKHKRIVNVPNDRSKIIVIARGLHENDAYQLEMLLIHLYGRVDLGTGCLHNKTDGGDGASNPSPEGRARISAAWKGKKRPEFSEIHLERLSSSHLGQVAHNKGKKASAELRAKLSLAHKGKKQSAETIAKRVAKLIGKKRSAEFKQRQPQYMLGNILGVRAAAA